MVFNFASVEERAALEEDDADIYPRLGIIRQSRFIKKHESPDKLCQDDIRVSRSYPQPGLLPLTLRDLQAFHAGLGSMEGSWAALSFAGNRRTPLNLDQFRCVIAFGSIELAIRLVQEQDISDASRIS